MPILQLDRLECFYPDDPGAGPDEIEVTVDADGRSTVYSSGERSMEWGARQELTTPGGIPFTDFAVIRLKEHDPTRTESLGRVVIKYPLPEGRQTAYLPSEFVVTGRAGWDYYDTPSYGLTYHVEASEEDVSLPLNRIELLSLKCNDAQGYKDTVFLLVNEDQKWGPVNMWTGKEVDLGHPHHPRLDFYSSATVKLQEVRNEHWNSQFTVRYGDEDYRTNEHLTHTFRMSHTSLDDATYTLTYFLRRLSVSEALHDVLDDVVGTHIGVFDDSLSPR